MFTFHALIYTLPVIALRFKAIRRKGFSLALGRWAVAVLVSFAVKVLGVSPEVVTIVCVFATFFIGYNLIFAYSLIQIEHLCRRRG
ncbi:MAG: hypothetical protein CR993_07955 [Rhodobacterales bacterium]|nr:MAG: hypothetical protein CR993_07955 [Rhodobacterales bacterium]